MGKDPSAITASREAFYAADPIDRVLAVFDLGCNHAGKPFVPTHKQVESVNLYGHVARAARAQVRAWLRARQIPVQEPSVP